MSNKDTINKLSAKTACGVLKWHRTWNLLGAWMEEAEYKFEGDSTVTEFKMKQEVGDLVRLFIDQREFVTSATQRVAIDILIASIKQYRVDRQNEIDAGINSKLQNW